MAAARPPPPTAGRLLDRRADAVLPFEQDRYRSRARVDPARRIVVRGAADEIGRQVCLSHIIAPKSTAHTRVERQLRRSTSQLRTLELLRFLRVRYTCMVHRHVTTRATSSRISRPRPSPPERGRLEAPPHRSEADLRRSSTGTARVIIADRASIRLRPRLAEFILGAHPAGRCRARGSAAAAARGLDELRTRALTSSKSSEPVPSSRTRKCLFDALFVARRVLGFLR